MTILAELPLNLVPVIVPAVPEAQSPDGRKVQQGAEDASRYWNEAFGGWSIDRVDRRADPWEMKNRRRLFLIDKKFHSPEGLCAAEEEELGRLQADFESHLDSIRPLPNRVLDELEALAEQLEAEDRRS